MIRSMLAITNHAKNTSILSKLKGLLGYGDLSEDEYGRAMVVKNVGWCENKDVPINEPVKYSLNSEITITETKCCTSSTSVNKSCVFKRSCDCWLHVQNKVIVEPNPDTSLLTPINAPFLLYCEDLKSLEPSAFILGQVLDAIFIIISDDLFKFGIKVFILQESFFTSIHSDSSLEAVVPKYCNDIDFIVAASFYNKHWSLILIDCRNRYIFYLDPIFDGYVPKNKMDMDLDIVNNIIWYCVLGNGLNTDIPDEIDGWKIINHRSFTPAVNKVLPKQEYGSDCGMFVIMYFWYLTHNASFDFSTKDMTKVRNWWYYGILDKSIYNNLSNYISWLLSKMNSTKLGGLFIYDVPIADNTINHICLAMAWLSRNEEMFSRLPSYPSIVNMSEGEQSTILSQLECSPLDNEVYHKLCDQIVLFFMKNRTFKHLWMS